MMSLSIRGIVTMTVRILATPASPCRKVIGVRRWRHAKNPSLGQSMAGDLSIFRMGTRMQNTPIFLGRERAPSYPSFGTVDQRPKTLCLERCSHAPGLSAASPPLLSNEARSEPIRIPRTGPPNARGNGG